MTDTTSPADGLGPLPLYYSRFHHEAGMPMYTAAQMRAYALQERAAERERMDRLYDVVSRMVEQDHVVNLTRLHDYCADEPGLSAETVDGGPADAYEASIAAAERERCAKVCEALMIPDAWYEDADYSRGAGDCADAVRAQP